MARVLELGLQVKIDAAYKKVRAEGEALRFLDEGTEHWINIFRLQQLEGDVGPKVRIRVEEKNEQDEVALDLQIAIVNYITLSLLQTRSLVSDKASENQ